MRSTRILTRHLALHGERIVYRIAGLPITLGALLAMGGAPSTALVLRRAYARHFWQPDTMGEAFDLATALCIWPVAVLAGALWFTWQNGPPIARRSGKSCWRQLIEQLRLALTAGVLPPWYYVFSLHDGQCRGEARNFLNRCETKRGVYRVLARRCAPTSPLRDKVAFAEHCRRHRLPVVPILAIAREGRIEGAAGVDEAGPAADLFIKLVTGRGGTGAERWDHAGGDRFRHTDGRTLSWAALLERLRAESGERPRLVQPRLRNHPLIADLSNGALSTVRALTCLDEQGRPELVGAVMRMAVGANRTVDNLHAGGIAAGVDLATGVLTSATNLGMDARLGWLDRHPDTGAPIAGRSFPRWTEMRALALDAHRAFSDRIYVGWDIALCEAGPVLIEGNLAPDLDIMQRPSRSGLASGRFGELLAFHLQHDAAQVPGLPCHDSRAMEATLAGEARG